MNKKLQAGQASRTIIIMLIVVFLAGLLVFFGLRLAGGQKAISNAPETPEVPEEPKPVYEAQFKDINIKLVSARNLGNVLVDTKSGYHQDVRTTEKFIQVVIQAQNTGKTNIDFGTWGMTDLIDGDERVFNQIGNAGYYFLPQPDLCGAMLKPDFSPTMCVRIFEVAKNSGKLKVKLFGPQEPGKTDPVYLDLYVTQ